MTNLYIAYLNHLETVRNNKVVSTEVNRHNVAQETETNRHNVVMEGLESDRIAESKRHSLVVESQGAIQLQETQRHNLATEAVGVMQAQAAVSQAQSSAINAATQRMRYYMDEEHYQYQDRNAYYSVLNAEEANQIREDELEFAKFKEMRLAGQDSSRLSLGWNELYLDQLNSEAERFKDYSIGANQGTQAAKNIKSLFYDW